MLVWMVEFSCWLILVYAFCSLFLAILATHSSNAIQWKQDDLHNYGGNM
jgi:preprotein translocase subunit SecG